MIPTLMLNIYPDLRYYWVKNLLYLIFLRMYVLLWSVKLIEPDWLNNDDNNMELDENWNILHCYINATWLLFLKIIYVIMKIIWN